MSQASTRLRSGVGTIQEKMAGRDDPLAFKGQSNRRTKRQPFQHQGQVFAGRGWRPAGSLELFLSSDPMPRRALSDG